MRILHVCWDLGQGGIQRYLVDLLAVQSEENECTLLVLSSPGPLSEELSGLPVDVSYIGMKGGMDFVSFPRILRFLRHGNHEVIHSHANNIIFNMSLAFQNAPVVYTEHGGRFLKKDLASRLLYGFFTGNIDRFIAISDFMGRLMRERSHQIRDRIKVVHNGIPFNESNEVQVSESLHARLSLSPDVPIVGFLGRLVPEKGVDSFIEIAGLVHESHPEVKFVVIGEGPLLEKLQSEVHSRGLEESVIFLGFQSRARQLLSSCSLLTMTSRKEAFGLVILEAYAVSVPVVALGLESAASEIIRDGIDGYVVENSGVEYLAQAVTSLLNDPEGARIMGERGKERLTATYTIEKNAENLYQIYSELTL